ncbi:MAG: RDD family protein [Deltaproteobacteria bacterium]|nr:RDD family protein [Deltaproteobacteria bacterium]
MPVPPIPAPSAQVQARPPSQTREFIPPTPAPPRQTREFVPPTAPAPAPAPLAAPVPVSLPAPIAAAPAPAPRLPEPEPEPMKPPPVQVRAPEPAPALRLPEPEAEPVKPAPLPIQPSEPRAEAPRPAPVRAVPPVDAGPLTVRASPASLWRRVGAWLVDLAVLSPFGLAYAKGAQVLMKHPPPPTQNTGLDYLVNRVDAYHGLIGPTLALAGVVLLVYSALFHGMGGRTPGKRLFGIRLVDGTGRPPSLARSLIRAILSLVSLGALGLGYLLALFTRRRRALHDALSGTYVVRLLAG